VALQQELQSTQGSLQTSTRARRERGQRREDREERTKKRGQRRENKDGPSIQSKMPPIEIVNYVP
jgi:hypothetical protein